MVGKGRQGRHAQVQAQVAGGEGQPDAKGKSNLEKEPSRLTPYQRIRQILAGEGNSQTRIISTVEDLQAFLKKNSNGEKVILRMKLLWVSDHSHKQLKFVRHHFVDADSPEPLDNLLKAFRETYAENSRDVDTLLFTATAWDVDPEDERLPPAGTIAQILSYANLGSFRGVQWKDTIRPAHLSWT